ncbi:MAG: hypothetical protein A2X23_00250 [Chloroflexi bacterium GWC2_73_18]|nr:MAG: hypothetical protein A2X23_00250 [Chloroflexi bacterium GWC2_73_18]
MDKNKGVGILLLRLVLGWGFLYAGLAKVIDFEGSGEPFSAFGFLKFATGGTAPGMGEGQIVNPAHDFWVGLTANPALIDVINFLVVFGELAIGAALILGLATRFAAIMGALMMALFWLAAWDFQHGIVNNQLLYGVTALFLGYVNAGHYYGVDAIVEKAAETTRAPVLRLLSGHLH